MYLDLTPNQILLRLKFIFMLENRSVFAEFGSLPNFRAKTVAPILNFLMDRCPKNEPSA